MVAMSDIGQWLEGLGLGDYAELFRANDIDLDLLPELTPEDLKEIGVTSVGHRRQLLNAIAGLGGGAPPAPDPPSAPEPPPPDPKPAPEPDSADAAAGQTVERRQVTILFADLSGYTRLTRTLGAEKTHRLAQRFYDIVNQLVVTHGGVVERHIGDAVMAVFGVPVAHSNDPERALRTAFGIHEAMPQLSAEIGEVITVHAGVASGQIVASSAGDASADFATVGESVNLAARLVALAEPGETIISGTVWRAVSDLIDAEDIGEVSVKGLDQTVRAWRVRSLRGDRNLVDRGLFVGRKVELRQTANASEWCRDSKSGQVIYIRGEAGIGKTRFTEEFARRALADGFQRHTGQILDFGTGRGQDAIGRIVGTLLGAAPGAGETVRADAVEAALGDGRLRANQRVFVHDLLDLPQQGAARATYDAMDNAARNQGKQACVTSLIERISAERPLLITVEDVHWADNALLDMLAAIAATTRDRAVLMVMTSRIEGDQIDAAWRVRAGQPSVVTIDLGPLRDDEARALAGQISTGISDHVAADCVARSEGNPLFLEQLLRSAAARDNETVPGSIQSIVLARLDQLPETDQMAIRSASVLGQRFAPETLRHLIDDPAYDMTGLVEPQLVRPTGGEFMFAHALIRDGTYDSLLEEQRRALHRRAANWFADRDLVLEAEHLDRAGDDRAANAYLRAAEAERDAFRYERAAGLFARGLELATDDADRYRLLTEGGEILRELGRVPDSIDYYRQALAIAADEPAKCRALIGIAAGMRVSDNYKEALEALDRAELIAEAEELDLERSQTHYYRGNLYFPLGRIEECLVEQQKALDYAHRAGSVEGEARALSGLGDAHYLQGRMITAHDYFRRCVDFSRANALTRIEAGNRYMVAWTMLYQNDVGGSVTEALESVEAAAAIGHRRAEVVARMSAVRSLYEAGDYAAVLDHVEAGLAVVEQIGAGRFQPGFAVFASRAKLAQGADRAALAQEVEDAYGMARETGIKFMGPWVLSTLALITEDPDRRLAALKEGEQLLATGCVGHNYFAFYPDAMDVALAAGDWASAAVYADRLAAYSADEPLPWATFFVARGRVLTAVGQGADDAATRDEIRRLHDIARTGGIVHGLPGLDAALESLNG